MKRGVLLYYLDPCRGRARYSIISPIGGKALRAFMEELSDGVGIAPVKVVKLRRPPTMRIDSVAERVSIQIPLSEEMEFIARVESLEDVLSRRGLHPISLDTVLDILQRAITKAERVSIVIPENMVLCRIAADDESVNIEILRFTQCVGRLRDVVSMLIMQIDAVPIDHSVVDALSRKALYVSVPHESSSLIEVLLLNRGAVVSRRPSESASAFVDALYMVRVCSDDKVWLLKTSVLRNLCR